MITNFKQQSRKDDMKLLTWIIVGFLFVAWLCTPPGNKFLQICFWGNNTKFFISKLTNNYVDTEYIFHRNNAVYLAKMFPKDAKKALKEMDKAIETIPSFVSDKELKSLYKDRAQIKLFMGDYKGALSDFINSDNILFNENLTVAMLFKEAGNYREAMSYCNKILNIDSSAYAGFVCMSDIYNTLGRPEVSIRVWDLAIDRKKNNPRAYVDRALLKKKIGDLSGYESDIKLAKEYSPTINIEEKSLAYEALHPKILMLSIR